MKKLWSFLAVILMSFMLANPLAAAPSAYVVDQAGLLDAGQKADLEGRIKQIRDKFKFDIVIVTTKDAATNKTPLVFTADYYMDNGYGVGPSRDGLILLLDMKARDWSIVGTGHGQKVFTDWGTSELGKSILPDLGKGRYYDAFSTFTRLSERFLQAYADGNPITATNPYLDSYFYGFCIILALVAASLLTSGVKASLLSQMKTVIAQYDASDYAKNMALVNNEDIFLYERVSSVKKVVAPPPRSNSGSVTSSSSSFKSSSGSSHSGSSGKF